MGTVERVFVAGAGGEPMQAVDEVQAVAGRGLDGARLAGRAFRIGGATFAYDRPRPPCRYIAGLTEAGMTRALAARRGGICARVVHSGLLRAGDEIELLPAEPGGNRNDPPGSAPPRP